MRDVLLLNADYAPVQVVAWERAVCLLLAQRVYAVASYPGRQVRSPTLTMAWPAVVALVNYAGARMAPRLSRRNVFARDGFSCQYCGSAPVNGDGVPAVRELTLDHVAPRAHAVRGRVTLPWRDLPVSITSWENLTTACGPCNHRKADRTPEQASMTLRSRPRRPSPSDRLRIVLAMVQVPPEWEDFL